MNDEEVLLYLKRKMECQRIKAGLEELRKRVESAKKNDAKPN